MLILLLMEYSAAVKSEAVQRQKGAASAHKRRLPVHVGDLSAADTSSPVLGLSISFDSLPGWSAGMRDREETRHSSMTSNRARRAEE